MAREHWQRRWKKLKATVVKQEPLCQLRLPGCTGLSQTADHKIPVKLRPDLAYTRTNLQGACHPCNRRKGARLLDPAPPPADALDWFTD